MTSEKYERMIECKKKSYNQNAIKELLLKWDEIFMQYEKCFGFGLVINVNKWGILWQVWDEISNIMMSNDR